MTETCGYLGTEHKLISPYCVLRYQSAELPTLPRGWSVRRRGTVHHRYRRDACIRQACGELLVARCRRSGPKHSLNSSLPESLARNHSDVKCTSRRSTFGA
ncbi:hypothetical protein E2C01_046977 [Portunus trituberculatus]|uniref:Uncharacterized protein n=1 Tax=Portunus trituberculatus TaxID=210409 RepID=A0A5B7G760_PORTR|nr:hypothetical protein [Portunus trituberculatus]